MTTGQSAKVVDPSRPQQDAKVVDSAPPQKPLVHYPDGYSPYDADVEVGAFKGVAATAAEEEQRVNQEQCFNVQWLLFVIGLFITPVAIVACFLPLCSRPRFPTRCHKSGWIANIVLSILSVVAAVVLVVLQLKYPETTGTSYYYYSG